MKFLYSLVLLNIICSTIFADSQEIVSLEMIPLVQQPISPQEAVVPPSILPPQRYPWTAVSLSGIFPGLGHLYLDDFKTASCLMGSAAASVAVMMQDMPKDASLLSPKGGNWYSLGALAFSTTASYGMYAAYRDARKANPFVSYSYQMPEDSFMDLTLASFSWSVLKKPQVWAGVLGTLGASSLVAILIPHKETKAASLVAASRSPFFPAIALPVGIGEEALFRGFLQSAFSEATNPITGTILSSLLFGAAHIPNATILFTEKSDQLHYYAVGIPFITAIGVYCGWLTHSNRSLKESVAFHTWYDFILFSMDVFEKRNKAAVTEPSTFTFAIPF